MSFKHLSGHVESVENKEEKRESTPPCNLM